MSEKSIIKKLIAAFEYAKKKIIETNKPECICDLAYEYIIFNINTDREYEDASNYFKAFFNPVRFNIKYLYTIESTAADSIDITTVSPAKIKRLFWFPLEIEYNKNRIEICNKAIEMLNKRLKEL